MVWKKRVKPRELNCAWNLGFPRRSGGDGNVHVFMERRMPATWPKCSWPKTWGPIPYRAWYALSCRQWCAGRVSTPTDLFAGFPGVNTPSKVQAGSRAPISVPDCPVNHGWKSAPPNSPGPVGPSRSRGHQTGSTLEWNDQVRMGAAGSRAGFGSQLQCKLQEGIKSSPWESMAMLRGASWWGRDWSYHF